MQQHIDLQQVRRVAAPAQQLVAALPVREQLLHFLRLRADHPQFQIRPLATQRGDDPDRQRQALALPFLTDETDHAAVHRRGMPFARRQRRHPGTTGAVSLWAYSDNSARAVAG